VGSVAPSTAAVTAAVTAAITAGIGTVAAATTRSADVAGTVMIAAPAGMVAVQYVMKAACNA